MLDSLLRKLSRNKTGVSKWLNGQASRYVDLYNDFGYDFDTNGESLVLERLSRNAFKTVFDVGANVGDWSRVASTFFPSATFHAFELSPNTRSVLARNLADPRYVVPDLALGSIEGEVEYKDYGELSAVNTLTPTTFHDGRLAFSMRKASLTTGDSYLATTNIEVLDFLKIDVEGAEFEVLEGFRQSLGNHRVRVIQFEYGYANGDAGHLMKDFYALLTEAGYEVGKIWTAGVRFSPFAYRMNNFDSGPNYLAVARGETGILESLRSPI